MKEAILKSIIKTIGNLASGIRGHRKLSILIYHRVLDKPDFMRSYEVDKEKFSWHMDLLSKYFNVLPLDIALTKLENNTLPPRAVAITFDDGYADNLLNAVPILKSYDMTATFFIATGFLDGGIMWNDAIIESVRLMPEGKLDLSSIKLGIHDISTQAKKTEVALYLIDEIKHLDYSQRDKVTQYISALVSKLPKDLMLTSNQLKMLFEKGMDIGGHTITHPILAKIEDAAARKEIINNKETLRKILGHEPKFFAYPNGKPSNDYLPQHIKMVKEAGYEASLSTQWGVSGLSSDIWQLPRFTPWDNTVNKFIFRMFYMYLKG